MYKAALVGCGRMGGSIDDEVLDYPAIILPYSHAAAYAALEQVELVAAADVNDQALAALRQRWGVPRGYTDYRRMIDEVQPDILSVTTHATSHAEIVIYAAEHGVRAIYGEKPMACSLEEAERMREACEANGVKFNIGTSRRYHPGYEKMRALAESGELGEPKVAYYFGGGALLHTHSHSIDTLCYLLGDPQALTVEGRLQLQPQEVAAKRLSSDPVLQHAHLLFEGGREAFLLPAPGLYEFQLVCTQGVLYAWNNGIHWSVRQSACASRWHVLEPTEFPLFERKSATLRCLEDLIAALETGAPSSGNLTVAMQTMEISWGLVRSSALGGIAVSLPVAERSLYIPAR